MLLKGWLATGLGPVIRRRTRTAVAGVAEEGQGAFASLDAIEEIAAGKIRACEVRDRAEAADLENSKPRGCARVSPLGVRADDLTIAAETSIATLKKACGGKAHG